MATWSAESIIDTVFIPLYALLLIVNALNCVKHGVIGNAAYVFLTLVSALKIVGNIMTVIVSTGGSDSTSLETWGLILSQLGFYPLINATLSFMRKWISIWKPADFNVERFSAMIRGVHLIVLPAVVCSVLGGVWSSPGDDNINTGYTIRRIGTIIFVLGVVAIFAVAFLMRSSSSTPEQRNDKVLMQVFYVLPIMFVRIIYATVQNFKSTPSSPGRNTWVYLCLLLIPDFVSASIYTWFGAFVLKPLKQVAEQQIGYPLTTQGQPQNGFQQKPVYQEPY